MNWKRFPRRSLKTRVTLFTLSIFLTGIWSLAFYAGRTLREDMQRLLGDQQFSTVYIVAAEVNHELDQRLRALESVAGSIGPALLGNAAALQTVLAQRAVFQSLFNGGTFATGLDGTAIASIPLSAERAGVNYMDRDYMIAALGEGKATIGRPVMGRQSRAPVFGMAVPIRDAEGGVIGALIGVTALGKPNFLGRITERRYGKTGDYLLVAPQHRLIITASDKSRIMEVLPAPGVIPPIDRFLQGYDGTSLYVNPRGVEVLTSSKGVSAAGWQVAAILPTAEAFAPIRAMQQRISIAAIFLTLLAGGLTWWMLRRQLAPMLAAARTLATLSETNQPPQPLPITRRDEVGDLIGGFNRLLETLGQREVALRESEGRFRTLIDWSIEAIAVHRDGKLIYVNPAAVKMIGARSAQDLAGKSIFDWVHPDYRQMALVRLQNVTDTGVAAPLIEQKYVKFDGTVIDVEVQSTSIVYDGEPAIQVAMRDITERKRAEHALEESEKRFRGLIEQSLAGIYIARDNVFLYANPRLEQMLGYAPGEMVGIKAEDIVLAEDLPIMQAEREKLRAGATSSAYEVRARRRNGAIIELGVQGRIYTLDGKPATVGMAQDISDKKRAEEQIQRYIEQLRTAFMSTVKVATTLSEMRDPYTAGHERRVAGIAVAIGTELGLDEQRIEGLRVAGFLHDVGKITIPAEILSKPGRLSVIEFQLIQGHAQAGYDVLKTVEFPWPVAEVALQHHERIDGSGYPQGLKGEAILFEARILAVADVIEAMSSHRPYREGLGIDAALAAIERGRGTAYDPAVADACLKLFREKGYAIPV